MCSERSPEGTVCGHEDLTLHSASACMDNEFQMVGPADARVTLVQAVPRQSRITRRLRTYGSQSFSRRCDARMKNTAATR